MRLLLETGILGVATYFGALGLLLASLFRRRGRGGPTAVWVDSAIFSLVALLLLSLVENVLYVQGFPSTVLALTAIAMKGLDQDRARGRQQGAGVQ